MHPIHAAPGRASAADTLHFSVRDGATNNTFYRDGPVAAHLLLTDGAAPRILVAFPAGNSSVALWFEGGADAAAFGAPAQLRPVTQVDARGRVLHGIEAEISLSGGAHEVRQALLCNVRTLRDYQTLGTIPQGVACAARTEAGAAHWARDRLDGEAGYALSLAVLDGTLLIGAGGRIRLEPDAAGRLRLALRALTGEAPLTPLAADRLLAEPEGADAHALQCLSFLSYEEKLLAGSWRFNTYFGRDTLMSLRLLLPALAPAAAQAAFGSVLNRLGAGGDVAHEEDVGECAVLHHRRHGGGAGPVFDYKMVDDDFMLAPVVAAYLLETPAGPARAAAFLGSRCDDGRSFGAALMGNFALVLDKALPFARDPGAANLVHLKDGQITGDWRDSGDGLGGGVVSYSVNAVLVPAALRAVAALCASAHFAPYLDGDDYLAGAASEAAAVWEEHARAFFAVAVEPAAARRAVLAHADELGVNAAAALGRVPAAALCFDAVALDAHGAPVPVMHSDFGFALLFQNPPDALLAEQVGAVMRPFPAGLMTGAGLLVANAAFAKPELRALFGPDAYHGAVVWSWQQALLAAGLARQLGRTDLGAATRAILVLAQDDLWRVIKRTREFGNMELWSWSYAAGAYAVRPFGPLCATADESNAAQLWSTVYLAVRAPR